VREGQTSTSPVRRLALLKESVRRRKTDPNALRELRKHLQATK